MITIGTVYKLQFQQTPLEKLIYSLQVTFSTNTFGKLIYYTFIWIIFYKKSKKKREETDLCPSERKMDARWAVLSYTSK